MGGFDEEYERRLEEARERAGGTGRGDVLEYLNLKASNDRVRARGVEWLLESFTAAAGELNRAGAGLALVRTDAHRFRVGSSTMVGTRLVLRRGVRQLTVEAGWPRAPRDGIVRGGGLASAQVGHFGNARAGEELLLLPSPDGEARWFVLEEKTGARAELTASRLRRHLARLLDCDPPVDYLRRGLHVLVNRACASSFDCPRSPACPSRRRALFFRRSTISLPDRVCPRHKPCETRVRDGCREPRFPGRKRQINSRGLQPQGDRR